MEPRTAKLAVGDGFQPHVVLKRNDLSDGTVFNLAELHRTDFPFGLAIASLKKVFGTKKTSDMVVSGGQGITHVDLGKRLKQKEIEWQGLKRCGF